MFASASCLPAFWIQRVLSWNISNTTTRRKGNSPKTTVSVILHVWYASGPQQGRNNMFYGFSDDLLFHCILQIWLQFHLETGMENGSTRMRWGNETKKQRFQHMQKYCPFRASISRFLYAHKKIIEILCATSNIAYKYTHCIFVCIYLISLHNPI